MSAVGLFGWANGAQRWGAVITASASTTGYEASRLRAGRIAHTWRSNNATGAKTLVVYFGPGGFPVRVVALYATNLDDSATVTVEFNDTDVWTSPSEGPTAITMSGGEGRLDLGKHLQYAYARISMTDAANPDAYLEVGALGLWCCEELPDCISLGDLSVPFSDPSSSVVTMHGAQTNRTLTVSADLMVSFTGLRRHQAQRLREIFREVGAGAPVWLCTDVTDLFGREQCYGTIAQIPSEDLAGNPTGLWADMNGLAITADRAAA